MGRFRFSALKVKQEIPIPARTGVGFRLARGEYVQVVDPEGQQCGDLFAYNAEDVTEHLSAEHTRVFVDRLFPLEGQSFVTNLRRPILMLEQDHSPGIHDMLFAACDPPRYAQYGVREWHPSCAENLRTAMKALGHEVCHVPQPVNLFMQVAVLPDGRVDFRPPATSPGDWVLLKAFIDCLVVISACPQQWNPAANYRPSDLLARILIAG
ncbi:MAG: urea carboxylase-associated family protein [Candidatus Rokubacteria bacterium]|nr:urea carboxylase-associated family protein [Candidatus Rokubacteria bacterium]